MKEKVLSAIDKGRENAKTQHVLAAELGIHPRTVRLRIAALRDEGHEIGSSSAPDGGYYICQTEQERRLFQISMRKRGAKIFATATKLDNTAKMRNQETYLTRVRGAVR